MKQSTRATIRQLALWSERGDRIQPAEEVRDEVTRVLADLLLEAMGIKVSASQPGDDDESKDFV